MKTQLTLVLACLFVAFCGHTQELSLDQQIHKLEGKIEVDKSDFNTIIQLSETYNLNSSYYLSLHLLKDYQNSHQHLSSPKLAKLYLSLAKTYKFLDKNGEANLYFLQSSKEFIKTKDYSGYLLCGIERIEFCRRTRRFEEGIQLFYFYSHFAKKKNLKSMKIQIGLYNRFAALLNEYKGQFETSIHYSNKALELAEKNNDKNNCAISYNEIGYSYANLQQEDSALIFYEKAANTYRELGFTREYVHVWYNILSLKCRYNRMPIDQQIEEVWMLARFIDSAHVDYYKTEVYHTLRTLYFKKGDYKASCEADFIYEKNLSKEFQRIQNQKIQEVAERFQNKELQNENKRIIQQDKEKTKELSSAKIQVLLSILALLIVIAALVAVYYLWYRLKKSTKLLVKRDEQKTVLIQEIHHRVKNNLQFVRSMLELQTYNTESTEEAESLTDVSRRISAMSLVHEMLYINSENLGVSLKNYLNELTKHTAESLPPQTPIRFNVSVIDIEIPIDRMVAIGVICSELFTNSAKHAFNNTEAPLIELEVVSTEQNQLKIIISDNGTENTIQSRRHSLGMRLIDIFSRQLNGTYKIERINGYAFEMIFPL